MKRFLALLTLLLLTGCIEKPKPAPTPQPPDKALNVVFIYDPAEETAEQAAIYTNPDLISYCDKSKHELRVIPTANVDENANHTPLYLLPYYAAVKDKKLPAMVLGRSGKIANVYPLPGDAQTAISLIQKQIGDAEDNTVWAGGEVRRLGCLPLRGGAEERWPTESADKLISESDWKDVNFDYLASPILDQNGYSCCAACATNESLECGINRMGLTPVVLSVVDTYSRGNGGRDAGMTLEDCLTIAKQGVCTTQYATMWGVSDCQHKLGWEADRKKHSLQYASLCPTLAHVATAIQKRRPVVVGIMVTTNFSPNKEFVIGKPGGMVRGGHAIVFLGMKKIGSEWYFRMQNSWGERWGDKGKAWLHQSWFNPGFGAWAVIAAVSPSDDKLTAP